MIQDEAKLRRFLRAIPKAIHHLHIEGSIDPELAGVDPAHPPRFWQDDYRFKDFADFRDGMLQYSFPYFTSLEHYREGTARMLADLRKQNVRYVEPSIRVPALSEIDATPDEIFSAIEATAPKGLRARVFLGLSRDGARCYEPNKALLAEALQSPHLAGIDLHGAEIPLEPWTAPFWEEARRHGKFTKAHIGEGYEADRMHEVARIRWEMTQLKCDRYEHGVVIGHDPALTKEVADRRIALDMTPISNVKMGVVSSYREHPLIPLHKAGVPTTISPDDTFFFGNFDVTKDYLAIAQNSDLTYRDLGEIAKNGFDVALISDAEKAKFKGQIDRLVLAYERSDRKDQAKVPVRTLDLPQQSPQPKNLEAFRAAPVRRIRAGTVPAPWDGKTQERS